MTCLTRTRKRPPMTPRHVARSKRGRCSRAVHFGAIWQLSIILSCWGSPGGHVAGETVAVRQSAATDAAVVARLERAIEDELADKQLPAFSILIHDGSADATWSAGYGWCDPERERAATAQTIYRVGSVSKLFTDLAVMKLVEQNKLALDAPLSTWLPELQPRNPWNEPLTLRQLMSHRAGLVRESPVGNYFDPTEPSLSETVLSLNQTSLVYPPGRRTKYSNAGIAVVGYLIERTQGVPFSKWLEQNLLGPLEMTQSSFDRTEEVAAQQATGWMWSYDDRRFPAPDFALGTIPAGNLYSSVAELQHLLAMIFGKGRYRDRQIVRPETLELMINPAPDSTGQPPAFGIGFHLSELDGHKKIGHGGAVYGYSTQFEALPERQLGIIAVASLDGSNGVVERLVDYGLRLMLASQDGRPLPDYPRTVPIPPERAGQLTGRYGRGPMTLEISRDGDQLYLHHGSFRRRLRMQDERIVVDDVFGFGPELQRDTQGQLTLDDERYERVDENCPPPAPERWRGLLGEYGWDHNPLYILEDHGQLYALIEWFYYYPLREVAPSEFAFPDYGLYHGEKLHFQRNSQGIAEQVVAANVTFPRREVGTRQGETFRIDPVRPVDTLRVEAQAASPPDEPGEFRDSDFVEVVQLDPTIRLDLRYATTNNFMQAIFYRQARAFLQRPAAEALVRVHHRLQSDGLGLLIHDAYRPWYVTKMFWDATPESMKSFVANPALGSRHNRGCAVDLTLFELSSGRPVEMVAGYDEFSPRSFPEYPGGTSRQRWHRRKLREAMESEGFTIYDYEWWHFDFADWTKYRISNQTFDELNLSQESPCHVPHLP